MRQGQQIAGAAAVAASPKSLARNFGSNGPDVKIRGTAAHIAEKYMSLARDALASGDMITAESYFQHAEHYNRIIMAAQSQFGPQHGGHPGEGGNGGSPAALERRRPATTTMSPSGDAAAGTSAGGIAGGDFRQGGGGRRPRARMRQPGADHGGGRDRGRHGGPSSDRPR